MKTQYTFEVINMTKEREIYEDEDIEMSDL